MLKNKANVTKNAQSDSFTFEDQHGRFVHGLRANLNNIGAVARIEWQLQLHSLAFWILLLLNISLMALLLWSSISAQSYWNGSNLAVAVSTGTFDYVLLILPFFFMNTFIRDEKRGMYAILWTRPLSVTEYVCGKGITVAILSSIVSIVSAIFDWGLISWKVGTVQPWQPWLEIAGILVISMIAMAWLVLLAVRLLGPLPGALLCAIIPTYLFFQKNHSMLDITNINVFHIYYSQSIQFGPDSALLIAQRLFYCLLAGVFLFGLLFLFRWREPRSLLPRFQLIITSSIGIVLVIALIAASFHFEQTVQQYQDVSAAPAQPSTAQFSHYSLRASVDPTSGTIDGTARFLLTPANNSDAAFYIALLPSLQIQHIAVAKHTNASAFTETINYTSSAGWTKPQLAQTDYGQGHAVWIEIHYQGEFQVGRDKYADPQFGLFSGRTDQNTLTSYIGNGTSFLGGNGGGIWYPLPWTRQISQYGNRLPMDEAQLTFPASATVVSSVVSPQRTADTQTITISPHGALPLAFVAAIVMPQQIQIDQVTVYYAGPYPDATRLRSYNAVIQQTITLATWLHGDSRASDHWHVMVMPFLNQPIVGSGLLLLPEFPLYSSMRLNLSDQTILTRFAGGEVARSWWLNAVHGESDVFNVKPTLQNQQGSIKFLTQGQTIDALASYSAAIATDRILGHGFFGQEEAACSKGNHNVALNLGIEFCPSQVTALYHLHDQYGASHVTQILQTFAQSEAQQAATWSHFVTAANTVLHRDITDELTPYICTTSKQGASQTKGSTSDKSCLNTGQGA